MSKMSRFIEAWSKKNKQTMNPNKKVKPTYCTMSKAMEGMATNYCICNKNYISLLKIVKQATGEGNCWG